MSGARHQARQANPHPSLQTPIQLWLGLSVCGLQQPFGKSFLHACAPPANNSKPGQQAGRSITSEAKEAIGHAAHPEQPKSWQTTMFYGLQTTLQSAVFGKCSSRETLQNKLFGGCCLQKTCRNIVLGECGLQGGIAKPKVSPRTCLLYTSPSPRD